MWIVFFSPFVFGIILFGLISAGTFGELPGFEELENPKTNIATEIFSADGELLGKFFKENRTVVEFTEVSPTVLNALIATEDIRFYEHSAIDYRALVRVFKGIVTLNLDGGGSTITQQLAKNLFRMRDDLDKSGIVMTKLKEWVVAVRLERSYTKEEILAMYLNTVDFGSNAFGIKSAARTFFDTTPDSLTLSEAAVLVGALKAPTMYNPKLNPKNAKNRSNTVLDQVRRNESKLKNYHGYKPQPKAYYDSLKKEPIRLKYSVQSHTLGIAQHFREYLRHLLNAKEPVRPKKADITTIEFRTYLSDSIEWARNPLYGWIQKNPKPDGTLYNIYEDGLKIYTTINFEMQTYAEAAVRRHMGGTLQPLFYQRHKGRDKAPFAGILKDSEIKNILVSAMKRTQRYRTLKKEGLDSAEIATIFRTPVEMTVFKWKRKAEKIGTNTEYIGIPSEVDTLMSPWDSIRYYKFFLHAGLMSLEPQTGSVRAYVGDIDFRHFKYDNVSLARRQVGSTFKPFIYSVAMEDGLSPCHKVPNIPVTFEKGWEGLPKDFTPRYSKSKSEGGMITLKNGLASSLNQISAWIMKRYGTHAVVDMASKSGVKSYLDAVPSLCVGAAEVHLSEMVAAYDTYANKGVHVEPIVVSRIEDRHGNVVAKFEATHNEALSEITAFKMLQLMRGVVDRGTSTKLRNYFGFKNEIAGKTGTTNDNSDGWFIGMVPNLVTGVWVGGEERSIRFMSGGDGQGSAMALPIWGYYMRQVFKNPKLGVSVEAFETPDELDSDDMDCSGGGAEDDYNSHTGWEETEEY